MDEMHEFNTTKTDSIFLIYSAAPVVIYQWMELPKILQPAVERTTFINIFSLSLLYNLHFEWSVKNRCLRISNKKTDKPD